jgi:nucleoside-diphosphate-sugar epimerase
MTKIFLTGGSGFIGGELSRLILAQGFELKNLDLVTPHFTEQAPYWVQGDVRDAEKLTREVVAFQPDYLIHLASDIDVQITELSQFTTTIGGTRNVVEAVKAVPGLKRFVHISTQFTVQPGVAPPDEEYLEPYTVYGEAKAETERIVRGANLECSWVIVRPTIIWGPNHPSFRENIFRHISARTYLHPVARKKVVRAYGYVTNTADQMLKLALADSAVLSRHVYYAGDATIDNDLWADAFALALTGKRARRIPVALLQFMGAVGDMMKKLKLPAPIDSGRAFRMSTSSAVDLAPTLAVTGTPPVPFAEGVTRTMAWLRHEA